MWCDTCEANVHAPSGICDTCGADLLGFGQSMALEDDEYAGLCEFCEVGDAMPYCDLCDDCYTFISESDPDQYPEVCQSCCSMMLHPGQSLCDVCLSDKEESVSRRPSSRYDEYDWWTGEVMVNLPIPPVEEELELIPALRKV
jgi:hypothetical protein